ncbi:Uncharacterised protein [Vibrio cholerae]|nr:Uncharacterised protein [Vibrio cholerae]
MVLKAGSHLNWAIKISAPIIGKGKMVVWL